MKNSLQKLLAFPGIHWLATRLGGVTLRRLSFDEKFRSGQWNFEIDNSPDLVRVIEKYAIKGDILMLGCGSAAIAGALDETSLNSLLGIDTSVEAIAKATKFSGAKMRFELGDMVRYKCHQDYDVILFSESLYYVAPWQRKSLLRKLRKHLRPHGKIIITIAQSRRYASLIQMVRRNFHVTEDYCLCGSVRHLLVFD